MLIYQQAGELVVFFEIDSFLPETTWSWELFADEGRQENVMIFRGQLGYRVRSTRILGHLSQGLVMSLKDFPGINSQYHRRISEVGHQTATHELLSRSLAETLGGSSLSTQNWYKTLGLRHLSSVRQGGSGSRTSSMMSLRRGIGIKSGILQRSSTVSL